MKSAADAPAKPAAKKVAPQAAKKTEGVPDLGPIGRDILERAARVRKALKGKKL